MLPRVLHQLRSVVRALSQILAIGLVSFLVIWNWPSASDDVRISAGMIATYLALGTVIASVYSIIQHMRYYTDRHVQARIIRILWLPPVYAVASMIGLRGEAWCSQCTT